MGTQHTGPGPLLSVKYPVLTLFGSVLFCKCPSDDLSMQQTPPALQHEPPTQVSVGWGELKEKATHVGTLSQHIASHAASVEPEGKGTAE